MAMITGYQIFFFLFSKEYTFLTSYRASLG